VKFPLKLNKYWELEFGIPEHALLKFPILKNTAIKFFYNLTRKDQYKSRRGIDSVYRFEAVGINDEIRTKSIYLFSEKYGFVEMEFQTFEGEKIVMVLEDIQKI
jgi:hypothetical protein